MSQHTQGPWKAAHAIQDDAAARYIWSATDRATGHRELVATIPYAEGDHINADARLIAAAPYMLLCLRNVIEAHGEVDQDLWNRIREAIANATGDAS